MSSALGKKALKMHNFYKLENLLFLQENEVGTKKGETQGKTQPANNRTRHLL